MHPIKLVLVTRGLHEKYTVLAVARTEQEAQQWAEAWNVFNQDKIKEDGDEAVVGDLVPAVIADSRDDELA